MAGSPCTSSLGGSVSFDPPRCVRRALLCGRTTRQITNRHPDAERPERRWRGRRRAGAAPGSASGRPRARLQSLVDQGATLRQAAAEVGLPADVVGYLGSCGRLLVRPRSPGYPCPVTWAKACARAARRLRHELADEMLAAGLSSTEVAEVVGVSRRAVTMWRASRAAARR